jgi:hypothetical protein
MAGTLADDVARLKAALDAADAAAQAVSTAKDAVNAHIPADGRPFALGDGRVVVRSGSALFIGAPLDPQTVPIP